MAVARASSPEDSANVRHAHHVFSPYRHHAAARFSGVSGIPLTKKRKANRLNG
jgi:hypothetical protein